MMYKRLINFSSGFLAFALLAFLASCTRDKKSIEPESGYPEAVAKIINNKCATAGCHNSISYGNAGGLDFSTWDRMFEGGRNGNSVIPFSTTYSYLLYFVNTDSARGPVVLPTMPLDGPPLSNQEYQVLYDWIASGAPDKNGKIMFADNPDRKKAYICMQGCDQVAVVDAGRKVIMRYIAVGDNPNQIEAPHLVRVSPDGKYWYVVFYSGEVIQKFRTSDDSYVGSVNIGSGDWNTIIISTDSKKGFVNATIAGKTTVVNLETMSVETSISPEFPHGGFITPDGRWLYLTSQSGNFINKVDLNDPFYNFDPVLLQPGEFKSTAPRYDAHEMMLTADASHYYVSCQGSAEVRVFKLSNDSLVRVIPVGNKPQEFAVSTTRPYMFITCTEHPVDVNKKGLVYVLNTSTHTKVDSIYTGYQPHGIAVDDDHDCVYVANLNYDSSGPAPHHVTACGGRNGYLTIIDMSNLKLLRKSLPNGATFEYKNELLSFPYFIDYRK